MGNLPKQYKWLSNEDGPKMITEALKLFDTSEDLSIPDSEYLQSVSTKHQNILFKLVSQKTSSKSWGFQF